MEDTIQQLKQVQSREMETLQKKHSHPEDFWNNIVSLLVSNVTSMDPHLQSYLLQSLKGNYAIPTILLSLLRSPTKRAQVFEALELLRKKELMPALDILLTLFLETIIPNKELRTYLRNQVVLAVRRLNKAEADKLNRMIETILKRSISKIKLIANL